MGRVVTETELDDIVAEARAEARTVVFTNGCFDLLHVGHLRSIVEARRSGDILIVGLNSDASVRLLKGPGRPVFPEHERAEMLAGFAAVDYVIIFDGRTVSELLRRYRPDIHAKGTDYTADSVPERHIVASYGGRTIITGDPKDHSSSAILEQLSTPPASSSQNKDGTV